MCWRPVPPPVVAGGLGAQTVELFKEEFGGRRRCGPPGFRVELTEELLIGRDS